MLTFEDSQDIVIEETGLSASDSTSLAKVKRDINRGATRFMAALGREYNRRSRVTNLVAGTQYYQYPEEALRVSLVKAQQGGYFPPLDQVPDEEAWAYLNMTSMSGQPTHFFVRGFDEIGLYPIPSANVTTGLEIVFEPKHGYMRADDVTNVTSSTTVTVTNGSQTVTNSGTAFTQSMVGQRFEITDGTDSRDYRISAFVSTSQITLENYYQGTSGSGKTFRIGEVVDIPEEYEEAPAYFAIYRHHKRRGNDKKAAEALAEFTFMRDEAKDVYGQQTSSQVVSTVPMMRPYNVFRGDAPPSVSAD